MSICKIAGINSHLATQKTKNTSNKTGFIRTFTDNSITDCQDSQNPLSSVKLLSLYDFTDSKSTSSASLCNYYFAKATEQYTKGEYFSAIHTFKRSLAYDPTHFESFINIGACYYHLQLLDEANVIFSRATKLFPDSPIPHINKALSEMQQQEYRRVITTVDHALEVLQDPPEELYKIRTYVLYQSGKITNILDDIKSKNGFEASKRFSNRSFVKTMEKKTSSLTRPRTSTSRKQRILHLFPYSEKTFVNVDESEKKSYFYGKTHAQTATSSPKQLTRPSSSSRRSHKVQRIPMKTHAKEEEIGKAEVIREKRAPVAEPKPVYKPGVIQINSLDKYEDIIEDHESADKFSNNLKALRSYVASDLERAEELKESAQDNEYQFISEHQIKVLVEEFSKKQRALDKIDKIAVKLDFLQKFPLAMRESIYQCAKIGNFSPGDVIFQEGDPSESMFVIIKGSVIINRKMQEVRNFPIIIASLYDGRQFGDISVLSTMSEQDSRKGTCIVTEPSTMFIIPKQEYKSLLFKYLRPELEAKAKFLSTVHLFKGTEQNFLYTLASNVIVHTYKLGDVILEKGETPKGMYIISRGHVEVVTEGYVKKSQRPKVYGNAKIREKSPRPFITGNHSPSISPKTKSFDDHFSKINPERGNHKSGSLEVGTLIKEKMLNFVLHAHEFFGGKTLLENEIVFGCQVYVTASKYTFIAKSSEVDIMMMTKDMIQFLDPQTEFRLKNILSKSFHIDSPDDIDPEQMDELFHKWQKYKTDIVGDIRKQKYVERNKMDFPYIR